MRRAAEAAERLAALKREIAAIEGRPAPLVWPEPPGGTASRPGVLDGTMSRSEARESPSSRLGDLDGAAGRSDVVGGGVARAVGDGARADAIAAAGATAAEAACGVSGGRAVARGGGAVPVAAVAAEAVGEGLAFGVEAIDRRLGPAGGLALGALHEIACDGSREAGAVTGFAAALVARLLARRPGRVVWITTAEARREVGRLDGPGLAALGLDPGRLVEVRAERPEEALWAFEEGLSCRAGVAVVAEIPGRPGALDLTATRRLALRARADGGSALGLLLRVAGPAQTTAAATRWRVSAAASRILGGFAPGLGRPAFRLELEKNRDGRLGSFEVEWSSHDRRFAFLPAHPGAVPAEALDRPAAPAGEGRVLAFERPRPR